MGSRVAWEMQILIVSSTNGGSIQTAEYNVKIRALRSFQDGRLRELNHKHSAETRIGNGPANLSKRDSIEVGAVTGLASYLIAAWSCTEALSHFWDALSYLTLVIMTTSCGGVAY